VPDNSNVNWDAVIELPARLTPSAAGRPSNTPVIWYAGFPCQAQSWHRARRVVAKVEWHKWELFPRVGFIVLNLSRPTKRVVRLQLPVLACNTGNFLRQAVLHGAVRHWTLTTLREKWIKIGAKVVRHARQVIFQIAEVAVPRKLFAASCGQLSG